MRLDARTTVRENREKRNLPELVPFSKEEEQAVDEHLVRQARFDALQNLEE